MGCNSRFVQNGLTQNVKMDHLKKLLQILQTKPMLTMYRCKYTSKAEIELRSLYNFDETLLNFEDPDARDKMRNKREIEMLSNAFFCT